jgi:ribose/xylose/arabinose/galactoside ABC-type transport system permease subunit
MTTVAGAAAETGGPAAEGGPDASGSLGRSRSRELLLAFTERYALVVLFVATLIFFSVWSKTSGTFPHATNIKNVLGGEAYSGILALAIMIPLVCGEFDFSVGNSAGLTQVLCAGFMARLQREHGGPDRGQLPHRHPGGLVGPARDRRVVHRRPVHQ